MNKGKSVQKSRTSKQEDKIKKDPKKEKGKPALSPSVKENTQTEKYRSGSLNRQGAPPKIHESPRKSQSVDRNRLVTAATATKENHRNTTKIKSDASKKASSSTTINTTSRKTINQNNSSTNQKKRSTDKSSKIGERKNSVQVAKSFVKNVQSKAPKLAQSSDSHKSVLKKHNIPNSDHQESILERPRTSTIRKGPPISEPVNAYPDGDNVTKGSKLLKTGSPLSGSKNSLNGESDNDKASYEEDFEEYDSDFEESDTPSISESDSSESSMEYNEGNTSDFQANESVVLENSSPITTLPTPPTELKTHARETKKKVEKTYLKISDRSSLFHEKNVSELSDKKPIKVSRSFINFESALKKDEEKNNEELSSLLDGFNLESYNHLPQEMLDMQQPIYNYSSIGKSNSKQVFVQTESCEEEEIQTDEVEMVNKWTQNPTNSTLGYGGDKMESVGDKTAAWKSLFNVNSTKLSSFLQKSSNIILTLLDEEFSAFSNDNKAKRRQNFFYSDGYYILPSFSFLSGLPVVNVSCSEGSPYIITIYGNMAQLPAENGTLDEKGVICVWNISESKKPDVLTANSQPTCGTFGPGGYDIVVAGMVDGAVMLWDLTDLNTSTLEVELDGPLTLRSPTYNTALILGSENHSSCVVGIQTVYNREKEDWRSSTSARTGTAKSFHIMTLEDMGVMNIWVVVEVLKPDISGLESDLGLAPGGKYRLLRSSCLPLYNLTTLHVGQKTSIRTFDFRLVPFDSSRMLVTTDAGIVLHVTRHSGVVEPRFYASETECSTEVRCIDCSPHNEDLFLVGCSDGSIKLHNIKLVRPLMEFLHGAKGEPVNLLKWSVVHPTVFCVLSTSSHIHLWNLIEDSTHPFQSYYFEDCKVSWFGFRSMEQTSSHQAKEKLTNFIIAKENGEVEIHAFQKTVTEHEYLKQLEYMQNL